MKFQNSQNQHKILSVQRKLQHEDDLKVFSVRLLTINTDAKEEMEQGNRNTRGTFHYPRVGQPKSSVTDEDKTYTCLGTQELRKPLSQGPFHRKLLVYGLQ